MRNALLAVLVLLSCSSEKDGKQPPAGGAPAAPADLANLKLEVKGGLEVIGGPFAGSYTWKPGLDLNCGCSESMKDGNADFTMSDAANKVFISATLKYDGTIAVRSGVMPGGMRGSGVSNTCTGEYAASTWHFVLDTPVKGRDASAQVKGTLDFGCR